MIITGVATVKCPDGTARTVLLTYQVFNVDHGRRVCYTSLGRAYPESGGYRVAYLAVIPVDPELVAAEADGRVFVPKGDDPASVEYREALRLSA